MMTSSSTATVASTTTTTATTTALEEASSAVMVEDLPTAANFDLGEPQGVEEWQEDDKDLVLSTLQEFFSPATAFVEDLTNGWGLAYADLGPETPETAAGQAFLWSNLAYALAGWAMASWAHNGELALATEVAGCVSYWYHWAQLRHGHANKNPVRLALMVDYTTAGFALVSSLYFLGVTATTLDAAPPVAIVASATLSLAFLGASWIWESSLSYIVWHSLWHILSAYAGYLVADWNSILA